MILGKSSLNKNKMRKLTPNQLQCKTIYLHSLMLLILRNPSTSIGIYFEGCLENIKIMETRQGRCFAEQSV